MSRPAKSFVAAHRAAASRLVLVFALADLDGHRMLHCSRFVSSKGLVRFAGDRAGCSVSPRASSPRPRAPRHLKASPVPSRIRSWRRPPARDLLGRRRHRLRFFGRVAAYGRVWSLVAASSVFAKALPPELPVLASGGPALAPHRRRSADCLGLEPTWWGCGRLETWWT